MLPRDSPSARYGQPRSSAHRRFDCPAKWRHCPSRRNDATRPRSGIRASARSAFRGSCSSASPPRAWCSSAPEERQKQKLRLLKFQPNKPPIGSEQRISIGVVSSWFATVKPSASNDSPICRASQLPIRTLIRKSITCILCRLGRLTADGRETGRVHGRSRPSNGRIQARVRRPQSGPLPPRCDLEIGHGPGQRLQSQVADYIILYCCIETAKGRRQCP